MVDYPEWLKRRIERHRRNVERNQQAFKNGRNAQKRRERAKVAELKGCPGGWKKGLRIWQETERMLRRGVEMQRARLAGAQP